MILKWIPILLSTSILLCHKASSENILFFFGVSTYSHRIIVWPLVEALADKNHSITFLQPYENKSPHPKVKEIVPKMDAIAESIDLMQQRFELGPRGLLLSLTYQLPQFGLSTCEAFLSNPEILQFLKTSKFDLIIIDALFNECAYGIAHLHKAKVIIFGTSHPFGWLPDTLGFPLESHAFPELHFGLDLPLNFINRILSFASTTYFHAIRYATFPKVEKVLREKLSLPDMPSIPEMMKDTSLVLTNTHFSEEITRSHPPNVVSVGGMTCKSKSQLKPIPKDILDFINKPEGFMLVSFGSGAKISSAPKPIQEIFFKAFAAAKINFLLKWESERPKEMPKNVMTTKWIPQQEILSHPKIRGFITHGGLISMHEAICHKVPMIAFPVFAEQDYNTERLNRTQRGIGLEITSLTQEQLDQAIQKILTDDTYMKNIEKAHVRFMDRPQTPVETAVWWTEYVLRHADDTDFMKPAGAHLNWYQRRLLDVWAFFTFLFFLIIYILFKLVKLIFKCFCNGSTSKKNSKKLKSS